MSLESQRDDLIDNINRAFRDAEELIDEGVTEVYDLFWNDDESRDLYADGELPERVARGLANDVDRIRDRAVNAAYNEAYTYFDVTIETDDLFDDFNEKIQNELNNLDWDGFYDEYISH